jgi:hypothetical protein
MMRNRAPNARCELDEENHLGYSAGHRPAYDMRRIQLFEKIQSQCQSSCNTGHAANQETSRTANSPASTIDAGLTQWVT